MREPVHHESHSVERAALDDRIALLSVLQELTVAVMRLFDPASPLDDFLDKFTARLGGSVTLCVAARGPGQPLTLRGSSGLARSSRGMELPGLPPGGVEDAVFPYPELRRRAHARWVVRVAPADEAPGSTWLLLWFEREPRSPLPYRGAVQRLATDLGLALAHREMVARVVESERALQRLNDELEERVRDRTGKLASAIVELRRRERALRALGACNEALGRAGNEQALLDEACRIVVEIGGYAACWAGLAAGAASLEVRPAASAVGAEAFPLADVARAEAERGQGAVAKAISTGTPSLVRGVPAGVLAAPDASMLALPLAVDGAALGALVIHAAEPDAFDLDELKLLGELAGNVAFGIGALRARARQLQMTAQLVQADRLAAIGTLAAGVAHEINNPLSYVLGGLHFLASQLEGLGAADATARDEARAALRDVRAGAERIRTIVRDLKTFARGEDSASRKLVELRSVLESAAQIACNEIRHRARLVVEYGPTPRVRASESRLGQVFLNLLINAVHSIPDGAIDRNRIVIRTSTDEQGRAVAEIRDTGCGMSPETLRRVFEPFYTTKPVGVGTGLGLSICHNIVAELGGVIEVESEEGKGSAFRVRLPAAPESGAEERPVEGRAEPGTRRGKVLVLDDERPVGIALRRVLAPDHDVVLLTSSLEAFERIARGDRFDAIVCDLMMPGLTGMELHARLRESAPDQAARMLFITGGAVTAQAREFLSSAANPRLEKPFDPGELRVAVQRVLAVASDAG